MKMGEKDQHREMGLGKPMRIHEVAHRTWPECYSVGYRRDIARHIRRIQLQYVTVIDIKSVLVGLGGESYGIRPRRRQIDE